MSQTATRCLLVERRETKPSDRGEGGCNASPGMKGACWTHVARPYYYPAGLATRRRLRRVMGLQKGLWLSPPTNITRVRKAKDVTFTSEQIAAKVILCSLGDPFVHCQRAGIGDIVTVYHWCARACLSHFCFGRNKVCVCPQRNSVSGVEPPLGVGVEVYVQPLVFLNKP